MSSQDAKTYDMQSYNDINQTIFNRGLTFTIQDYTFVTFVVLGEDIAVAYALSYEPSEYKKVQGTENEQEYLAEKRKEAEVTLQQQEVIQLREEISEGYRADIQQKALSLEQIEFTAADINALLNKLLATQAKDLDSASIREMLSIIHELVNNFGLSSGNDAFAKHFITIQPKFNALCHCGHEMDIVKGMDCICPHCKAVYKWSEDEQRYYPDYSEL